jgi:DNA-binding CsgD family transcriptional regulator
MIFPASADRDHGECFNFPAEFQRESLGLIGNLVELSSSIFYLVDPSLRHQGVYLHNVDNETEEIYKKYYHQLDPLNPRQFKKSQGRVVDIRDILSENALHSSEFYTGFMKPRKFEYMVDLFFRRSESIIAGISVIRQPDLPPFSRSDIKILEKLHPFLEFTLNRIYLPVRLVERDLLKERYDLTERELDVVELLVAGRNNQGIADVLAVSLPTIKSHLSHTFTKLNVSSRTELTSMIISLVNLR